MRAVRVGGEWERGSAQMYEEGDLTWLDWVDEDKWEVYEWSAAPKLPYDLAAIRHPVDVLGFVKKWGLLHSYGAENDDNGLPYVEEFMQESLHINWLLYLQGLLRPAHDPATTRRALAEYWTGVYSGEFVKAPRKWINDPRRRKTDPVQVSRLASRGNLESMQRDLRDILEQELEEQLLPAVQLSIRDLDYFDPSAQDEPPPGGFALEVVPRDLLARAYVELALQVTEGVAVATCPEDGRVFAVRDPRQTYCSTQCAGRARYRRFVERKKKSPPT